MTRPSVSRLLLNFIIVGLAAGNAWAERWRMEITHKLIFGQDVGGCEWVADSESGDLTTTSYANESKQPTTRPLTTAEQEKFCKLLKRLDVVFKSVGEPDSITLSHTAIVGIEYQLGTRHRRINLYIQDSSGLTLAKSSALKSLWNYAARLSGRPQKYTMEFMHSAAIVVDVK